METEGKNDAGHDRALENARGSMIPVEALAQLRNHQRQLDMDGVEVGVSRQALDEVLAAIDVKANMAAQAEVPMEDQRPLDANMQRLLDQHEVMGTCRALTQSLKAMADARASDGAEGHAVVCRRAARFVSVMAMQVTRFLVQPDLRLTHPALDFDVQALGCTISDGGDVMVMGQSDAHPMRTLPLHELVAAGPVSDMSRVMAQVLVRTLVQDGIGQLIKSGRMPGLEELTARHDVDFSGVAVGFEPPPGDEAFNVPSDSVWQPGDKVTIETAGGYMEGVAGEQLVEQPQSETVHNLSAHAGYVLKDGHAVPDDEQ